MPNPRNTIEKVLGKFVVPSDQCWEWTGKVAKNGYGHASWNMRTMLAHRLVYEQLVGPVPEGLTLDHTCKNKLCVNPAHLEPVTQQVNTRRWADTITHCPHGHEYDEANTYICKRGKRSCIACRDMRAKEI